MRRLYLQIYLAFVGILVLLSLLVGFAWWHVARVPEERRIYAEAARLAGELLPGPDQPVDEVRATLEDLATRFHHDVSLFDAGGTLVAAVGGPLPAPEPGRTESGWTRPPGRRGGPVWALHLPDGRWVIARHVHAGAGYGWIAWVGLIAASIAAGSYPLARRIAGRLERLQGRVEALGAGDLRARVAVEGRDEVARLAESFNRAADRIEKLVGAQRAMLASASHELRSPLARMRVAVELLGDARPELRERIARDIAELDELIGELLLASRLEMVDELETTSDVDLLALAAEEAAHAGAEVEGAPVHVAGDPRTLRRLVRNLLENARRHGAGTPVEVSVQALGPGARLRVCDRGPGVAESERERIFEPFYRPAGMRESGEGVGLGLALVRQIARHHEGEARCIPRDGGGTCFEVDLRTGAPTRASDAPGA